MSHSLPSRLTSISASPDDAAGARRGGGGRKRGASGGGGSSIGVNLILVVLLAGLMVAGWFVANQQQMLATEQKAREAAEARIALMEDRLRMTDETLTEAGSETKSELGRWESEIRKLWAVSNERNKGWIEGNQAALKKHDASLGNLNKSQSQLTAQIQELRKAIEAQGDVRTELAGVSRQVEQMVKTQRELVDKVNAARQSVASLQSGLANRVAENEQAVLSMDSYRAQVNNRLAELERLSAGG